MKKTQNRKVKAILADYKTLSETLSKKSEIMKTLSEKYNISTKSISRMLKTDNVSLKTDNNIPSYEEDYDPDYDYDDDAIPYLRNISRHMTETMQVEYISTKMVS